MNKPIQTKTTGYVDQDRPSAGGKIPWQPPELTFLGMLGDLVNGLGKTGGDHDSDGKGFQKPTGLG